MTIKTLLTKGSLGTVLQSWAGYPDKDCFKKIINIIL